MSAREDHAPAGARAAPSGWVRWRAAVIDRLLALPLLAALAPVVALAAVLIRADDGPPVVLGLARAGRGGRTFRMWKLRTMRAGDPSGRAAGAAITAVGDDRITRPGRWLRKARLDEVPQVVNVLRGEMALIGPRPEAPELVDPRSPEWARVLAVVPGITGATQLVVQDWEAQVLVGAHHEQRYVDEVLPVKLAVDAWYVERGGPLTDLVIVWSMFERYLLGRPSSAIERRVRREVPEARVVPDAGGGAVSGAGPKPRLGIPVTYQFSVRYLLRTGMLVRLAEVVDPVVLLAWDDPELVGELQAAGAEVRSLPEARFGEEYEVARRAAEVLHDLRLGSPTEPIDFRRRMTLYTPSVGRRLRMRRSIERLQARRPGAAQAISDEEQRLLETDTSLAEADDALGRWHLDAMMSVTPYHRLDELVLRAAGRRGMPLLASVISFDNVTARGWFSCRFDRYLVWNEHNRAELLRAYPGVRADQIGITGAPQFDFYVDPARRWDEDRWRAEAGLPPERPVVLYAGGPEQIVAHEPHLLAQLDEAVASGEIPGSPIILFRRHPMEPPERWAPVVAGCGNVVMDDPWAIGPAGITRSAASDRDIDRLVSTLAHSDVHVSTSSTMSVDGAFFDRPQVGPDYDDRPGRPAERLVHDLYRREHWLPIARSGGMVTARSRDELVAAVADGLTRPEARRAGRARMVREIVTYTDGGATERVVAEVAGALGRSVPSPGSHRERGAVKVTLLAVNYAPSVGGAQTHVRRLAEGLVERHGAEVEVLTTDALRPPGGREPGRIVEPTAVIGGVRVRRFPVARRWHGAARDARRLSLRLRRSGGVAAPSTVGPFAGRFALAAWRAGRQADAVVGCSAPFLTVVGGAAATRGGRAAWLVMPLLHLGAAEPPASVAWALRQADGCACSTDHERSWVEAHGVAPERIAVLPPGCDPDQYPDLTPTQARAALGLPERATVGFLGRLTPHKGVDTLLDAAPALWAEHPDTTVLLAGSATGWTGIDDRVARLTPEAKGRLVVRGGFTDDERGMLLAACDMIAFPSRDESFGMVTVEAWAARRPVVAADIGAVRCLIRPGVDGDLVAPGDHVGLAAALGALLDDPDRARRYGAVGRARAEAEFTWEGMVDGWQHLLIDSVARRRRERG